ncbi:urease accessory protein UreD [Glutamicibacter sp. AOP38-B1-38]|uniref:urease accessory protein UreD n=1 Tax=unclassified Glutamicibacter TaxID=2627139 RepID=UPI00403489F2
MAAPTARRVPALAPTPFAGRLVGELRLRIGRRSGKDIATAQYHQGALRVLRPHYLDDSAQVCYTIVNPGGGYLGADRYGIEVEVEAGSSLLLTTQSATKVYRTPQGEASQEMLVRLGPGAVLEYLPDQLIAYRDASYRQELVVDMAADASLVQFEILTPGWSPDGTLFRYDQLRLRTQVRVEGKLAVLDNLWVKPGDQSIDSQLYLQQATHVGMLLAVDARIDAVLVEQLREVAYRIAGQQRQAVQVGVSQTPTAGVAVRTLGTSTESATAVMLGIVNELRARLRGQGPVNLRKY